MGKKRERVPDVLWALYKDKARTLSTTILSLIPTNCDCNGRGKCLRCIFGFGPEAALSYLVTPHDPPDYRRFMKTCFVVVPESAPPFPPLISFTHFWSQLQIVERTIQGYFTKQTAPSSVMCHGYQRFKQLSSIVKLLTQSNWDLVLKRVGDSMMVYLLMHTLIFMPIKHNVHQQVTGLPVKRVFGKSPVHSPSSLMHAIHPKKRRRVNRKASTCEETPIMVPVEAVQFQLNSSHSVGTGNEVYVGAHCPELSTLSKLTKASTSFCDNVSHNLDAHDDKSIKTLEKRPGKRIRLPSWQRRKRCKKLVLESSSTKVPSGNISSAEGDLNKTPEHHFTENQWQDQLGPMSDRNSSNKVDDVPMCCPCCAVFQSLSQLPMDTQINRKPIFYNSKSSSSLFLEKHILNSLKPGITGINDLLQDIFGLASIDTINLPALCFHKKGFCSLGSPCLYHSFVKSLKVFKHRAKKCQHTKLLDKHCSSQLDFQFATGNTGSRLEGSEIEVELERPEKDTFQEVGQLRDRKKTPEVIQRHFGLSQPYCLKDEVVSFVWAVCRNILPPELLGVSSNRRILRRNVSKFIKLRRYEKFSLMQCMCKLEISKFYLLSKNESFKSFNSFASEHCSKEIPGLKAHVPKNTKYNTLKQTLLQRWIFWFFASIVVPLIQANFYVTESEHGKLNVYYYRKSIWEKLSDRFTTLLKDQSYQSLDNASVTEILRKRSFGFSRVRLCPKEAGARPIANLRAPSRFCIGRSHSFAHLPGKKRKRRVHSKSNRVTYFKSVNTVLRDLHLVFKDLKRKEPENWGSTVFCYNDIYKKLCQFLRHLKKGQAAMPIVYLVVSDVQKAFDTVKQDKLLSILDEIQTTDRYAIQKSSEIFCRKKCMWFSDDVKLISEGDNGGRAEVIPSARRRTFHTVSVNQEQSKTVNTKQLLLILKEHLKNNVLKLDQCFFLQTVGIPQGSVLSTLLCTLYYGHLERNVIIPYLLKSANDVAEHDDNRCAALDTTPDASFSSPQSMLLRFVDDFLFISTSKKQAITFFSRLRRGFCEYNCYMNQEKFCTNFDCDSLKPGSKRMLVGSDGVSFLQWSGLLINSCTLEVQADYSRYLNDHLSSTLTVSWQRKPGRKLKGKLRAYMRPKCHPLFFDPTINSPATIKLNVYQAFVLCAMKFHCYIRELSTWCKLHPKTYFTSVQASLRYMYKLMKRRMFKVNSSSVSQPILQVSKREVTWLGLTAYVGVLKRKNSRHKELLGMLRAKLAPFSSLSCSPELKYAVDDSNSSLLWKIKY